MELIQQDKHQSDDAVYMEVRIDMATYRIIEAINAKLHADNIPTSITSTAATVLWAGPKR